MRHFVFAVPALLALSFLGCQSSLPSSPAESGSDSLANATVGLGGAVHAEGVLQSALGIYRFEIDPATLTAISTLREARTGQANSDVYALAIDNFLRPSSLKIKGLSSSASTLDLEYVFTHPFPAPADPTGTPNGSTNRSDLAVSGMVMPLIDVASATGNTYFTDRVANTALVVNADGYFAPAGLITSSATANTFPYKLLVDETGPDGSRIGISNGGDPTGNYGSDGWTRAEYGAGNAGWTGYGVLHQGQASVNTLSLDRAAVAASGFSFDVAVIAVYNDPRGGSSAVQKRGNRLPPATPDHTKFAYRMPHGSMDVQRVVFEGEGGGFAPNAISASELRFHVEDWDARATETTEAALADDPAVTNVAVGESGVPTLSVCIPGVLGDANTSVDLIAGVIDDDSGAGGDAGADAGLPGDALYFAETVTKNAGSGQMPGLYTGMVQVSDITATAPLWIPLDEGTPPLPLTANLPVPVTYQAFQVVLGSVNTLPTGDWSIVANPIFDGGTTTIAVSNVVDPDSATFGIEVDWGLGGGFVSVATGLTPGAGPFSSGASPAYTLAVPSVSEMKTLAVRLVDEVTTNTNVATNVGGNQLTINPLPAGFAGWAYKPVITGSGNDYSYHITVDNLSNAYIAGWFNSGTVDFGGGLRSNPGDGTAYYFCKLSSAGTYLWDKTYQTGLCGTTQGFANVGGLTVDSANNLYVTGNYQGCLDLGGPTLTNNQTLAAGNDDLYIAKFDPNGAWQWQVSSTGEGLMNSTFSNDDAIDINAAGHLVASFDFGNTETFGAFTFTSSGGAASSNRDPGGVRLDSSGNVLWAGRLMTAPYVGIEDAPTCAIDDSGAMYFGGQVGNNADFGAGPVTVSGTYDGYILKLSPTGTFVWVKQISGTGSDDVWGLAKDSARIYAAGGYYTGANFGSGVRTSTSTGSDPFVAAWLHDGTAVWDQVFHSAGTSDNAAAIEANGGSLCATGMFYTTCDFGTAGMVTSNGSNDIWAASFDPATGTIDWVDTFGGINSDDGTDIAVDVSGDPYLTTRWRTTIDWDPGVGVLNLSTNGTTASDPMAAHWRKSTNSF